MKGHIIYDKTGLTERLYIKTLEYNGVFMGDKSITCTYKSPEIIPFAIGDYVEYRGEKFVLDYDPSDSKEAEVRRSGDAITYNLTFHPESHVELQNCDFCDYVLYDNQLHYSSSPKFSFIGTAHDLADRIKANLDRLYPGQWTIKIDPSVVTEDKNIEIENTSCWNAVVLFNKEYGLNFTVSNRTVKVGFPPVVVKHTFNYGINNGLYKIERNVNSDEAVITRLKAYGSDRNIPKDYNKLSTDIVPKKNLMLPGYKETGIDYIDSDNISIYGIRPQSVVFDDIYPSIEGVEVDGIGRIDEIVSAEQVTADTEAKGTFTIKIKDIGFDINDYLVSGETATISIKNGSLLGYEFEIVKVEKLDTGGYELTLNKSKRDNWQVPNKDQNLQSGNRFVLLHIRMPEKYVTYAEEKLLKRAKEFLARYDHVTYTYNIGVDEIFMARNISLYEGIMEGDKLPFYDANLSIDGEIIIQSLVITEGENIPTYKITLSDQPSSGTIDKIWDAINNIKNQGSVSGGYYGGGGMSPEELNKKYLHKDRPDQTDYLLGLNGGATFGTYVGGLLGSGGKFDKDGNIEGKSLTLREFLEVPELRFNRVDVVSGEMWNSIAFGLIESVDMDNRIVTLKLEDGELSGLHVNDFCRGIFHNLTGNETEESVDSSGFQTVVGFSTAYFTPVEIIDNAHFKYELKPGSTVHPCEFMKFAVYGNATDKSRQASAYSTRTYKRYLINVDTWDIDPSRNISYQEGDLSNLIINGESLKGGSVYLNNVYFGGNILTVGGLENPLKGKDAYSVILTTYNAVYNVADGIYEQLDVVTGDMNVVTGSDLVVASDFLVSTRIQASKGPDMLRYSDVIGEGKYVVTSEGVNCSYVISDGMVAVKEVTEDKAQIFIHVNCEGMATYDLEFTIVRVKNGEDGKDYEYIFTRTVNNVAPKAPVSEQTDDYVPSGWSDDPMGPTLQLPFEWVSKRTKRSTIWGDYSTPSLWSRFGEDGTDYEYIYTRTTTNSQPSTPGTSQNNDYVPTGWTDDPVGPTSDFPYEWVSQRAKNDSVWGNFSIPALWSRYAEDGKDHEFIYRRTNTNSAPATPSTSQTDDYVPSGWTDDPAGPNGSLPYEWVSERTKTKGVWGSFSTPSLWAKYSFDGQDGQPGSPGQDGKYNEDRYRRSTSQPSTPTGTNPSGWALDPPAGDTHLWMSTAIFYGNGTLYKTWSVPRQISGNNGKDGEPGKDGADGIHGPAITNRGAYSSTKQYVGNAIRVDVVKYGDYYYMAKTTAGAFSGQTPSTTSSYWERLQGQFESIATGLLIADEANISGWRFKENYIESQNNNVVLNGNADNTAKLAFGKNFANREDAPTRFYEDGRSVIKKGEIAGFTIENGWLKASSSPGSGIGYIRMETGNNNISFGEDLIPSQVGGAYTLTGLIENRKSNHGGSFGSENENIALKLSAKNATANWGLDCFGGIRKIGRGVDVIEPYIMGGNAMADLLETKIKYYNYFQLQPPANTTVIVRLPAYTTLTENLGSILPNGTPLSLGITTITISIQSGFTGKIVLVGVYNGRLANNNGELLNDNPISGYNYGTLGLTQGNIVKLGQFNGGWTPFYLSRGI